MTDQEHLERSYRRLLGWYPRAFRREKGPEILAVLMACARDGQRRPGLAEAADLIRGGLWLRLRPGVPRSARTVRAAVRLMGAGAAITAVNLIISLTIVLARRAGIEAEIKAGWQPSPTAAQVSQLYTSAVTAGVVSCVALVAVWLWMARANGRGRGWARILYTVLSGPAALTLIFPQFVIVPQWVPLIGNNPLVIGFVPFSPTPFVPGVGPIGPVLTGLVSLAAVCLLWLPASSAYFRPSPRYLQALQQAHRIEAARIRSSGRRFQRLM
jgi:hypothetical protein